MSSATTATRERLIDLARRVQKSIGSERECDRMMDALEDALPNSDILDLIFYPEGPEMTAEQIIDEALRREAAASTPRA